MIFHNLFNHGLMVNRITTHGRDALAASPPAAKSPTAKADAASRVSTDMCYGVWGELLPRQLARKLEIDAARIVGLARRREIQIGEQNLMRAIVRQVEQHVAHDGVVL